MRSLANYSYPQQWYSFPQVYQHLMLLLYVNNSDRTDLLVANTLRKSNQIQQRVDSVNFKMFSDTPPIENQDLRIYDCATVKQYSYQGCLRYWPFDENAGTTSADEIAGVNMTVTGALAWGTGKNGSAFVWDGNTANYLSAVNPFQADVTVAAVSLFVKFSTFAVNNSIFYRLFGHTQYPRMHLKSNGDLVLQFRIDGVTKTCTVTGFTTGRSTGTYYHIVANFNNSTGTTLFVDKVLVATNTDTGTDYDGGVNDIRIGYDNNLTYSMNGSVDELYLFNRNLTQDEIDGLYSNFGEFVILNNSYQEGVGKFRVGQSVFASIGETDMEKLEISAYDEDTRKLNFTTRPTSTLIIGDKIGEIFFGGVVARVEDMNIHSLENLEYNVTGVDYTKIFDKKLVSDSWQDKDSRYIINDFLNSTVNYNSVVDNMEYADNAAIQAEWIEANDGGNPTIDASDFMEGEASAVFPWTNTGANVAVWAATPSSRDISEFTGAASGTPTKGRLMGWVKTSDYADITSLKVRIGSDSTNYAEVTFPLVNTTDWQYVEAKLATATIVGTPVWTARDYVQVRVAETANGTIRLNGLRVNSEGSFTMFNTQSTPLFDDLRSPQLKPMALLQQIAKTWEYIAYFDYERDLHFAPNETEEAPFEITDDTDNFFDLSMEVDTSNLGNRVIVRGGEKTSDSRYAQVFEGNGVVREWILKNKFNALEVLIDDNSSTDLMEATTTSTTVKATAHGLTTGDHIVNRTRSNAVRQVTVVDPDTFTVQSVASQASGDTFSKFSVTTVIGIEGIADETVTEYVYNSNEKSVRATATEAVLTSGIFIRMEYNERLNIQIQYTDSASANSLRALGIGDGVFDLDPITDRNIQDINTAISLAQARVQEFSNPVITITFETEMQGLRAGQILHVLQTVGRGIDVNYVIQQISIKQQDGKFRDRFVYSVTAGTTLFGWIEFMQKLLRTKDSIELNVDDIVETYATSNEIVESSDVNATALGGFKTATQAEIVETSDVNNVYETTPPWQWEPSVGQAISTRYDLAEWA